MSQNVTLFKSLVESYVYLLCLDPAGNGSNTRWKESDTHDVYIRNI